MHSIRTLKLMECNLNNKGHLAKKNLHRLSEVGCHKIDILYNHAICPCARDLSPEKRSCIQLAVLLILI